MVRQFRNRNNFQDSLTETFRVQYSAEDAKKKLGRTLFHQPRNYFPSPPPFSSIETKNVSFLIVHGLYPFLCLKVLNMYAGNRNLEKSKILCTNRFLSHPFACCKNASNFAFWRLSFQVLLLGAHQLHENGHCSVM